MTTINTLALLEAAIVDWVARTDLTGAAVVDTFIDLAENEIVSGVYGPDGRVVIPPLRCSAMETHTAAFALSGEYTALPTGFLGFRAVKVVGSPNRKMEYVTPAFFDATYLSTDTSSDSRAYTIEGGQLRVGPNASASDVLDIVYYTTPTALTGTTSNWLLLAAPNCYLYGALRHLCVYTGMDSKLPYFQSVFISQLAALHASQKSLAFSGVTLAAQNIGLTTS